MSSFEKEAIQKQIQQDWANREYIEIITGSIKKIADFLNSFGKSFYNNQRCIDTLSSIIKLVLNTYFSSGRYVLPRKTCSIK